MRSRRDFLAKYIAYPRRLPAQKVGDISPDLSWRDSFISAGVPQTQYGCLPRAVPLPHKALTVFKGTDYGAVPKLAAEAAKDAHDKCIQINVLGVGTPKGAPIPIGGKGNYMKDESGNIVITQPNEQIAQDVANAGKGIYVSGTNRDALNVLDARLKELSKSNISKNVFSPNDEQFPVFAWGALALLICDIFVLDRKISWLKNINFFSK